MHHRIGQRRGFLVAHAAQEYRHQQGRRLIVGQRSAGDAGHEKLNLVASQETAVAFLENDIDGAHEGGSISEWTSSPATDELGVASSGSPRPGSCRRVTLVTRGAGDL